VCIKLSSTEVFVKEHHVQVQRKNSHPPLPVSRHIYLSLVSLKRNEPLQCAPKVNVADDRYILNNMLYSELLKHLFSIHFS